MLRVIDWWCRANYHKISDSTNHVQDLGMEAQWATHKTHFSGKETASFIGTTGLLLRVEDTAYVRNKGSRGLLIGLSDSD